MLWKKSI